MQQEFQQLGKDLQAGNLSAAQSDFATLQQYAPQSSSTSSQSTNPVAQEFTQLGKDLQSGNITAAEQDFTAIQQDFQGHSTQAHGHHHHGAGSSTSSSDQLSQLMSQLGQALQSGDLTSAQTAYTSLQQEFEQFAQTSGSTASSQQSSSNAVSISA